MLYVLKGNLHDTFSATNLHLFFFLGGGAFFGADNRNFGGCASHIFGSVLKTWGEHVCIESGIHLGGCHSSDDHILKTVGRECTSTIFPFVSSRHSHTYQLYIIWDPTRTWHDVHVFGIVCS